MCNDLVISHGEPIEHNATFSAKEWTWHRISTSCSLFHATRSPGSVKTLVPVGHSIFDDSSSRRRCISLILSNDHSLSRQCKLGSSEFRRTIVNANWWGLRAGYMQNGWNTVESAKPVDGGAAEELTRRTTSRKNFADFYFISSALRLVPPTATRRTKDIESSLCSVNYYVRVATRSLNLSSSSHGGVASLHREPQPQDNRMSNVTSLPLTAALPGTVMQSLILVVVVIKLLVGTIN